MILEAEELRDIPVLILANKQDHPNSMSVEEITEKLKLNKLNDSHRWHIQATVATLGSGLNEGFEWLSNQL